MNEYLPNSYLLGIHLTISTHSGQQIVYSYPPATVECVSALTSNSKRPTNNNSKILNKRKDESFKFQNTQFERTVSHESSSSSSSWSSGLSDSELSTDYSDQSFSSESDNNDGFSSISSFNDGSIRRNGSSIYRLSTDKLMETFNFTKSDDDDGDDEDGTNSTKQGDTDLVEFNETFFTRENYMDIDKIFGFNSEFVSEFCTPDRDLCNSRFEFTIDEFCFLGLPIHNDSNGKWRKSKHKRRSSKKSSSISQYKRKHSVISSSAHSMLSSYSRGKGVETESPRGKSNYNTESVSTSKVGSDLDDEDDLNDLDKSMNMFHVCFVLNPPLVEYNNRIDDMYQCVVAKLSLILRYVQSRSNFVSKECNIILKERERVTKRSETYKSLQTPAEKGKYLYRRILAKSCLARSLTKCVDQLHKNEIASIEIGDDKMISLQIPIQNEFQHLPEHKVSEILPHSFLTSISSKKFLERASISHKPRSSDVKTNLMGSTLSRHRNHDSLVKNPTNLSFQNQDCDNDNDDILNYALLLLDDPANILKNLESMTMGAGNTASNDVNSIVLRHIIKQIQPTTPLMSYHYIITETLQIEPSTLSYDILRSCALHLIYWRHARIIIPISSKYTYVVSPIISLNDIYQEDEKIFREKFPSLPQLSYFLSKLSKSTNFDLVSNKNDRDHIKRSKHVGETNYGNKPFSMLIPSKEHKGIYLGALSWLIRFGYVYQLLTFVYIRVDKRIKMNVEEDLEREGFRKYGKSKKPLANRKNINNLTFASLNDGTNNNGILNDRDDTMNKDATMYAKGVDNLMADDKNINDDPTKEDNQRNEYNLPFEFDDPELQHDYTVILEPERATALEKRWIFKCISDQPADIQILFKKLLKYFNGKTPLELIILREGLSRHEIKRLLNGLDKYLIEVHHW